MTSHILPSQSFKPAQPLGFGKALSRLAAAAARTTSALMFALQRPARAPRRLSRIEEANQLRDYASQFFKTDRGFAADLLAAADRHELGDKA